MMSPRGRAGGRPRVTVGLPVRNGERYLGEALDSLLGQTYTDFELIISDNASRDGTERLCREAAQRDPRVRYLRQSRNIGAAPNHNVLIREARGELFTWASDDDLYSAQHLERCIAALDSAPAAVLAHCWDAVIDENGSITDVPPYRLLTEDPSPSVRLHSLLWTDGGNDIYGVIRADVLRHIRPHGSHHHADRTFVAELALRGPFVHVPEVLYFRREHAARTTRASVSHQVAIFDPRRKSRWHPRARLVGEYVASYVTAVLRSPLSPGERVRCLEVVAAWVAARGWRYAGRVVGSALEKTRS